MKKIVFFGSGYYVIPVVEKLKNQGLVFVVTTEKEGKFVDYLRSNNIPYFYSKLKTFEDIKRIKGLESDLGILASYGALIPKQVIEIFSLGILNIHPSLLPKYKGPSPVQFTILDGNTTAGVSIIKLDEQVDHGPIIYQKTIDLKGDETLKSLTELLFLQGSEMISNIVQKINQGLIIKEKSQRINNDKVTTKIKKSDGKIDLKSPPQKDELLRKIRAFYPWPGVYLNVSLRGKYKILKLMPNDTVQVEGKNKMTYQDFINGYGKEVEDILSRLSLI